MSTRILIVVHQETSTPGRIGLLLRERGCELDICRPCIGHELPHDLDGYAGVVVFGGPMSANDCQLHDFIKAELEWLEKPLRQDVPLLGVCLGAQLLARHLGARVAEHPEKHAEVGYYPIRPTDEGRQMGKWPSHVYQWHRDGFDLPTGASLLAEGGNEFPNQAYRYGRAAYGIQFHPEVTLAMMHRWTVKGAHRLALPGTRPRHTHFRDRLQYDHEVADWIGRFLDHWLSLSKQKSEVAA